MLSDHSSRYTGAVALNATVFLEYVVDGGILSSSNVFAKQNLEIYLVACSQGGLCLRLNSRYSCTTRCSS